jgi:hypothetical protein
MKPVETHKTYGLITGILMSVFSIVIYVAGLAFKPGMQYASTLPFIIGLVLNALAFSKANNKQITFGQAFSSGFKATAIIALITLAATVLMMFVFPQMKEEGLAMAREQMAKDPKMTQETIDTAVGFTEKYWNVFLIAGSIFGTLFTGAIISLVAAAIAPKGRPGSMVPQAPPPTDFK